MTLNKISQALILTGAVFLSACSDQASAPKASTDAAASIKQVQDSGPQLVNADTSRLDIYTDFSLTTDL